MQVVVIESQAINDDVSVWKDIKSEEVKTQKNNGWNECQDKQNPIEKIFMNMMKVFKKWKLYKMVRKILA
jgi:hypothetical protein